MRYRSTLHRSPEVSLRDAVLHGSAPDGGLYMPVEIPRLESDYLEHLPSLTFHEIAQDVAELFCGDEVPAQVLMNIVTESFNFPVPLITLNERLHILELFRADAGVQGFRRALHGTADGLFCGGIG